MVRLLLVTTRITITLRPNGPFNPTLGSTLLKCVWNRCAPNLQSGPPPLPADEDRETQGSNLCPLWDAQTTVDTAPNEQCSTFTGIRYFKFVSVMV